MTETFVGLVDAALQEATTLMGQVEDQDTRSYLAFRLVTHLLAAAGAVLSMASEDESKGEPLVTE